MRVPDRLLHIVGKCNYTKRQREHDWKMLTRVHAQVGMSDNLKEFISGHKRKATKRLLRHVR